MYPNKQQFVRSGRWWPIKRQNFRPYPLLYFLFPMTIQIFIQNVIPVPPFHVQHLMFVNLSSRHEYSWKTAQMALTTNQLYECICVCYTKYLSVFSNAMWQRPKPTKNILSSNKLTVFYMCFFSSSGEVEVVRIFIDNILNN